MLAQRIVDFFMRSIHYVLEGIHLPFLTDIVDKAIIDLEEFDPAKITDVILGWVDSFHEAGENLIKGLWYGIRHFFNDVLLPGLERLVQQALDLINLVTGTHSPSTEFAKIGKNWMAGLMKGIEDNISGPEKALVMASDRVMGVSPQTLPSSVVNNSGSVDQSFNPVVNANYYRTQAPNTILDDLAMVAALG
jgi:hypothetical protein